MSLKKTSGRFMSDVERYRGRKRSFSDGYELLGGFIRTLHGWLSSIWVEFAIILNTAQPVVWRKGLTPRSSWSSVRVTGSTTFNIFVWGYYLALNLHKFPHTESWRASVHRIRWRWAVSSISPGMDLVGFEVWLGGLWLAFHWFGFPQGCFRVAVLAHCLFRLLLR